MNCPHCGRPMAKGHITGNQIVRIIPDDGTHRETEYPNREFSPEEFKAANLEGMPLDMPFAGLAPWAEADYCLSCRKVICQLDILDTE